MTHSSGISANHTTISEETGHFSSQVTLAVNSHEEPNWPSDQCRTSWQGIAAPLMLLLSQIRLADCPPSAMPYNPARQPEKIMTPSVTVNTAHSEGYNQGFNAIWKIANMLYETGQFISHLDPLRFPSAEALPVKDKSIGNVTKVIRQPRYAVFLLKTTTQSSVPDDVNIASLYDFSCLNNGEDLSFAQVLRQIGKTLQNPVTMLAIESKNIDSWNKGRGCPKNAEIRWTINLTSKIDSIISQVMGLLPGSQPLAIAQNIIGPIFERVANDLERKPTSREQELLLLQQVTQQARVSIKTINHREQMRLKTQQAVTQKEPPVSLPAFHIKDGINHIYLERNGKVRGVPVREHSGIIYAVVSNEGKKRRERHQVYFNHLAQKWEMTGDGRFNRFSEREQRLIHQFSLGSYYRRPPELTDKTALYSVRDSLFHGSGRLQAIEMYGRLVPYRYDSATGKSFIYDALQTNGRAYEVVLAQNEWHLKANLNRKIKFESLYSLEHGKDLNVAIVRKVRGREILAQVNPETVFFWGKKYFRNEDGNLEPVSSKPRKHQSFKNKAGKNNSVDKKFSQEEMIDDEWEWCYRVKRWLDFAGLCSGRQTKYPVIGEGSVSTVYDTGDGYVIKKYSRKINREYKSRLRFAKNNAKGFNRYYGDSSGFVSVIPDTDGFASVSVRLKKIDGVALNNIKSISDKSLLTDMLLELKVKQLAENLATLLKNKGIAHYDINQGNVIYSKENGFSVIDFDSSIFAPDHEKISQSITDGMRSKFLYVLGETKNDVMERLAKLNQRQ